MDTSNRRPIEGGSGDVGDSSMESSDWRAKLQADLRERMVNRILDAMKMHLRVHGDEGLQDLRKVAVSFEEKIYTTATSQSDYMRKTCFKILTIETRSQNPMSDANSVNNSDPASLNSTNGDDWQQEVYEKIKTMKDLYLQDLNDMHQKLLRKLQQLDSLPQQPINEQHEKLKVFKNMVERFIAFLQIQKHNILFNYKDKLPTYEKQIVHVITSNIRKPAATQQPSPPPPPHMQQNISMNGTAAQQVNINPLVSYNGIAQTGDENIGDWKEEVYQKIKAMKDLYLLDLNDMHQKMLLKIQQHDPLPHQPKNEQIEKLKVFKNMLERFMAFLQIQKHNILANYKDKLSTYEKQIVHVIASNRRKPDPTQPQQHLPPPNMQSQSLQRLSQQTLNLQSSSLQQSSLSGGSTSNLDSVSGSGSGTQQVNPNMLHMKQQEQLKPGGGSPQSMFKTMQSANLIVQREASGGVLTSQSQSLAIGTPGISASEQPLERLLKVVKSISANALSSSVSDIGSVVSVIDRIAGSAPGNGPRAAVGEDLVSMTKYHLQETSFVTQKRTNSNHSTPVKRPRIETNHSLLEEIKEINRGLIYTTVDITTEDVDPAAASNGTVVKCSFSAVALAPNLKSQYGSAQMSPIPPLRLLVPANYPNCSPILLDNFPVEFSKEYEDLSVKAKSRFSISLRSLSQPMSLKEIARTWDICARAVISEYAQQTGGGTFSSKYGTWENCLSVVN